MKILKYFYFIGKLIFYDNLIEEFLDLGEQMKPMSNSLENWIRMYILGDPEVTANIYCKSRNLPNTDTQNYSTDLR